MRKQTTFLAVLSTAVFTASMAFPAYAKQPDGRKKTETGITTTPTEIPLQIHGRNPEMTGIT